MISGPFFGILCKIDIETFFINMTNPEFYVTNYHISKTESGYICQYEKIRTVYERNDEGDIDDDKKTEYKTTVEFDVPKRIINNLDNEFRKEFIKYKGMICDDGSLKITLTNELGQLFTYEDTYGGNHENITSLIDKLYDIAISKIENN